MNKIRFYLYVGLVIFHILFSGCSSAEIGTDQVYASPDFSVALEVNDEQEVHGSLLVLNSGDTSFPADNDFNAEMNLWNGNSELRAGVEAHMIQEVSPEEVITLAEGYWQLDPGPYFLTWGAPEYGGVITVFSVQEGNNDLNIGKSVSFRVKPISYDIQIARAGSIKEVRLDEDDNLVFRGETPIPAGGCILPIVFDSAGVVEGFPLGTCAQIAEGQWLMSLPADPDGHGIQITEDTTYQVILFSDDLLLPPSEPFVVHISPPVRN